MTKSGFVAVVGCPNVGKSTFVNAILGTQLSAISDKPQTTWHQIRGIHTEERGQIIFVDTPGIHQAFSSMNLALVANAVDAMRDSDIIFYLMDAKAQKSIDELFLNHFKVEADNRNIIIGVNKIDKASPAEITELDLQLKKYPHPVVFFSAQQERGTSEILDIIYERLPDGPILYDAEHSTDKSTRFVVSEYIRQAVFERLKDELPYEIFVEIETFREDKSPIVIEANIFVARKSQKQIVIGSGGKQLKSIGIRSRELIEELLGEKVYLELWVKVFHKWHKKDSALRRAGVMLSSKDQQRAIKHAESFDLLS